MQAESEIITLLLADDHSVVREGVHRILASVPDMLIVGEAENGREVKELVAQLQPDILLLDLKMPETSPFEIEKWVRENHPETVTLVLTAHDRDFYLAGMIDAGAAGYIQKSERAEELIAAIRRVAHGKVFFTAEQIDRASKWRRGAGDKWQKLTKRKREILLLVAQGQSNQTIANKLGVTLKTVAFHISQILDQLSLQSRTEAAAWLHKYIPDDLE